MRVALVLALTIISLAGCSVPPPASPAADGARVNRVMPPSGRFQGFPGNVYVALDTKTGLLCNTYDFYKSKQRNRDDGFQNLPSCISLYSEEEVSVDRELQAFNSDRADEGGDVK